MTLYIHFKFELSPYYVGYRMLAGCWLTFFFMKPKCYCIVWDTDSRNEVTAVIITFSLHMVREVLRNLSAQAQPPILQYM